jgi:hypothetical protein
MMIRFEDATLQQLDFLLGVAPFLSGYWLDVLVGWTEGIPITQHFYYEIYVWAEKKWVEDTLRNWGNIK